MQRHAEGADDRVEETETVHRQGIVGSRDSREAIGFLAIRWAAMADVEASRGQEKGRRRIRRGRRKSVRSRGGSKEDRD